LEGGDVLADAVVEDGVVAFGDELVEFFDEGGYFAELRADALFLGLGGLYALQLDLPVFELLDALADVLRFEAEEAVAGPFVIDDVGLEALRLAEV
jgi:hypothetical protein